MRCLLSTPCYRRWNAGLYQNWVRGKWYPVEVLPRLELTYNRAARCFYVEAGWLMFEFRLNLFGRER